MAGAESKPIGVICKVCRYFTISGQLVLAHERDTGHKEWEDAYFCWIEKKEEV